MPSLIRSDFHVSLASLVVDDIYYQRSNYYYALGKIEPWGNSGDTALTSIDSVQEDITTRNNLLFLKRVLPNDVSLVTSRYNWVTGTTYAFWDHTKEMRGTNFYVITTDNNVYKCLDNAGNIPSTDKPTGTSFSAFRTNDGYLWKYMYNVPSFKNTKFTSYAYTPVQRALSDSFYNKGSIDTVVVVSGGSGYNTTIQTNVVVSGGTTTGAGATAGMTVNALTGAVSSTTLTAGGTGYTKGAQVVFNTSTGQGAVGNVTIVAGIVTAITVTTGGTGYLNTDTVSIAVGRAEFAAAVSNVTGAIDHVVIINAGIGYVTAPTLTIVDTRVAAPGVTLGSGAYGNATALVTPVIYNGSVQRINIVDPGKDYSPLYTTTIGVTGDGSNAAFTPVIYNGAIVDVVVENPGGMYTHAELTVYNAGVGTGAVIKPLLSTSDFISNQSIVEQTAIAGAIHNIVLNNPTLNNGYTSDVTIVITGDGTGCVAKATISGNRISNIVVEDPGRGYNYATVSFVQPGRDVMVNVTDATAYVCLPPTSGHGHGAVAELYGETLAINTTLKKDPLLTNSLSGVSQDYRQYSLLKDPTLLTTGRYFKGTDDLVAYVAIFDVVSTLNIDEILMFGAIKFRVVNKLGFNVTLQQLGPGLVSAFPTLVAELDSARSYNVSSITSYPLANKYAGKLMYVSNENPFSFNDAQGIVIKTFLKF